LKKLTRILRVAIPMLVLLAAIGAATADTHFVWSSGSDGNGLSWATAKHAIAAAITDASSGDEIWVAADTYTENITLKAGVALYGGFSGSENTLGDRNWRTNVTIIDGNQNGSVVTVPTGVTSTTIIDGFTIQNGNGTVEASTAMVDRLPLVPILSRATLSATVRAQRAPESIFTSQQPDSRTTSYGTIRSRVPATEPSVVADCIVKIRALVVRS
jgi:hypothetical protein